MAEATTRAARPLPGGEPSGRPEPEPADAPPDGAADGPAQPLRNGPDAAPAPTAPVTTAPVTPGPATHGPMAAEPVARPDLRPVAPLPPVRSRRALIRIPLLLGVPALIAFGGLQAWLAGGRHVETDNAYVKTDKAQVSAEVSGRIDTVAVHQNDVVAAGDLLFTLDDEPFRIARDRADARAAAARTQVESQRLAYREALGEIELATTRIAFARTQLARQESLARADIGRAEDLDAARNDFQVATREAEVARQHAATLLAALAGDADVPVEQHPEYRAAQAARDEAALDLTRTRVTAPFPGVVSNTPNPGDYVERGRAVMSLVANEGMWVEANYKETDLTFVRPGQRAELHIDTYPQHTWTGTVQSIAEATGAEFALLPPQNATGNWVKVVQRIPVKIALDPGPADAPLRAGMSAVVTIDTGHQRRLADLKPKGW